MRRREFVTGLSALSTALLAVLGASAPNSVSAQASNKTARLAILSGNAVTSPAVTPLFRAFIEQLRLMGWDEGRNLVLDARHTEGRAELFAPRAAEIVASSPDVIFATNSQAIAALKAHTSSIPIVMADVSHPVEAGFIQSLARPGSNVTGVTNQSKDIGDKHYDFLREIEPRIERVAVMFTPSNAGSVLGLRDQTISAQQAGISLLPIPFEGPSDLEAAALAMRQQRAQALQVHTTPVAIMNRVAISKMAIESRLPTISFYPTMARDGLLMTYGADQVEGWRRAATYVDRVLRGQRPPDLPVEQPTAFKFHINQKTAKALGLTIPPTLLARADEVIE
jgi:putative tryptophan/tyrosine transport system substrate-binding protein